MPSDTLHPKDQGFNDCFAVVSVTYQIPGTHFLLSIRTIDPSDNTIHPGECPPTKAKSFKDR